MDVPLPHCRRFLQAVVCIRQVTSPVLGKVLALALEPRALRCSHQLRLESDPNSAGISETMRLSIPSDFIEIVSLLYLVTGKIQNKYFELFNTIPTYFIVRTLATLRQKIMFYLGQRALNLSNENPQNQFIVYF